MFEATLLSFREVCPRPRHHIRIMSQTATTQQPLALQLPTTQTRVGLAAVAMPTLHGILPVVVDGHRDWGSAWLDAEMTQTVTLCGGHVKLLLGEVGKRACFLAVGTASPPLESTCRFVVFCDRE